MAQSGKAPSASRSASVAAAVLATSLLLPAQLRAQPALRAENAVRRNSTEQVAWALPDVNVLVHQVLRRVVTQDKPGAIPMSEYTQRSFGRDETVNAVRRFTGRDVELAPSAFVSVDGWSTAHGLEVASCEGGTPSTCSAPVNAVWIAITRFERGDSPNELIVWYTTRFSARKDNQPVANAYSFSERWFRRGGVWKYEGFISVKGA